MDQHDRYEKLFDLVVQVHIMCERNTLTLEKNTKDVEEHIRRTKLLEAQMETALMPIKVFKWSVTFATGAAILAGFVKGLTTIFAGQRP